jgi:hypothetical protein
MISDITVARTGRRMLVSDRLILRRGGVSRAGKIYRKGAKVVKERKGKMTDKEF